MISGYLISVLFVLLQVNTPILERSISLSSNNREVSAILEDISRSGSFNLSYGKGIVPEGKAVSVSFNNTPVRRALTELLGNEVEFKEKDNYLILTRKKKSSKIKVTGFISEEDPKVPVKDATVYDRKSLASAVSDKTGYYELEIPAKSVNDLSVVVAKSDYEESTIIIPAADTMINLFIQPKTKPEPDSTLKQNIKELGDKTAGWFRKMGGFTHNKNISDTLHSKYQLGLLPYVGTNRKISGRVSNDYSLNLVGGYSESNKKLEVGGCFNVNRNQMRGVQLAGATNIVGDSASGCQIAGGVNVVGKSFKGAQIAGALNTGAGNVHGSQFAGLANVVKDTMRGVQISGGANVAAKSISGTQLSGGLNYAETVRGAQVAGGINIAKNVYGVQLAPINVADSIKGLPIGFLSFVKSGIHDFEISADETFYTNFAFRTGVIPFYNILLAGANPETYEHLIWYFGYGVGTGVRLGKKWVFESDITARHINREFFYNEISEMGRINLGFEFRPGKKFAISTALTLNTYVTDSRNAEFDGGFNSVAPYVHFEHRFKDGIDLKSWAGGKIAFRFF